MQSYGRRMSQFSIRAALPADSHLIVSLLRELAAYEKLQDNFTLDEAAVTRDMFGDACRCDLAFAGGEPVGIATWFWTYKSFGAARGLYVEDLFVRTRFRGRGYGRKLLAHLADIAVKADAFMLWQVLDWNAPSIAFYKSLGAAPQENWINYRLRGEALRRLAS
jgi:GNAT superfamily N-acetyltransferase